MFGSKKRKQKAQEKAKQEIAQDQQKQQVQQNSTQQTREKTTERVDSTVENTGDSTSIVDTKVVNNATSQTQQPLPTVEQQQNNQQNSLEQPKVKFFKRVKQGLTRTRTRLGSGMGNVFLGKKIIDDDLLEAIEMQLLTADVGIEATEQIISHLTERVKRKQLNDANALEMALKTELLDILKPSEQQLEIKSEAKPYVILMVGVNGVGKTTTIGKLAKHFQNTGKSVMLAAGDTFRAAAVEQLQTWGERNQIPVVAQHTGADSASVAYDALESAKSKGVDVLIVDTAGRLHTKQNLMTELEKVCRVMKKITPETPHEVMLVLDSGTGQNALRQAQEFNQTVGVTGIALTKLDGTAKGGIIFAIAKQLAIPIRFIGVGEQIEDLQPFYATEFIEALFAKDET